MTPGMNMGRCLLWYDVNAWRVCCHIIVAISEAPLTFRANNRFPGNIETVINCIDYRSLKIITQNNSVVNYF